CCSDRYDSDPGKGNHTGSTATDRTSGAGLYGRTRRDLFAVYHERGQPIMALTLFWILALTSVGSAILVVANKNPVRSALFLVLNFFVLALLYMTLSAQFIAAVQVVVYAGAIMVL